MTHLISTIQNYSISVLQEKYDTEKDKVLEILIRGKFLTKKSRAILLSNLKEMHDELDKKESLPNA